MSDLTAYLRQLRRDGWTVRLARGGHWHIRDARGRLIAVASATPSDRRGLANLRAQIRRAAQPIPPHPHPVKGLPHDPGS